MYNTTHALATKCQTLCVQSQFGITPVASIARIESGVDVYAVGASVIARADDSTLLSLSDTAGHKVAVLVHPIHCNVNVVSALY